jgi:hypothetical protein
MNQSILLPSLAALLSTAALHAEETARITPPTTAEPTESVQEQPLESDVNRHETRLLMISATVYDYSLTKLRWWHGGKEYEAVSNIDFNYVRPITYFNGSDTNCFLLMGIENVNSSRIRRVNQNEENSEQLPALSSFRQNKSSYLVTGERGSDVAAYKLLDELHQYFDENKASLIATYNEWEEANRHYQAWLKVNPPKKEEANTDVWLRPGAPDYSKSSTR